MERKQINTLIVNDDDLECTKKERTLEDINLSKVGFLMKDLNKFDLIIYKGKLGQKILKIKV